ncbi:hypothetical protein ABZ860_27265 [Microbispora sp. NPDC046973]|uniref:hypothetical protein n=1 Tax=Microbispora sp. NPDC046973 TaxID=3155022 RepID=UPI0033E4947B
MLKSKARGRIAGRAAAAGVVSAGLLLGLGALGAHADSKTVTYSCAPGTGGTAVAHDFTVTLSANTSAVTGTQYTATLNIQPLTTSAFPAPVAIASGASIELQPSVSASALPAGMTAGVSTPSPTGAALTASVTAQGSMPPLPTATLTITPAAQATSVVLTAKDFKISMVAPAGTGTTTTTTPTLLYTCTVATTGANTAPAVATIPVTSPSASASASASASPSASASASPSPRNTRTVYETVFASPTPPKTRKTRSSQVENTPGGGAATGGGGDAGPDARLFVLTGTALMLAAGAGGLVLRTRRRPVRQ